ncbi:MAG TPA: hypothetical protein VFC78_15925 [Tepidisphaeraceae bacterium]|nr:hypothetical protein [Tepidisphaeraceae bacterium]
MSIFFQALPTQNPEEPIKFPWRAGALVGAAFLFLGLGSTFGAMERTHYNYGFLNSTDARIDRIMMRWKRGGAEEGVGAGTLSPGDKAHNGVATPPPAPPESAMLTWRTLKDGKEHKLKVGIGKLVPAGARFDGTIWIKFNSDGVQVIPLTFDEMLRMIKSHKDFP